MKKIEDVDPKILEDFRKEWIDIGLNTDRCDRKKSEEAIEVIYRKAGYAKPKFIWAVSPIDAVSIILKYDGAGGEPESHESRYKENPNLGESTDIEFQSFITPEMVLEGVRKIVQSKGGKFPANDQEAQSKFNDTCKSFINSCFYGQHEWWVPQYLFPRQHMDAVYNDEANEIIDTWEILSRNCGWWGAFPEVALCVEKPIKQCINEQDQLHNDQGPAVLYEDGLALWLIDGLRVDEQIVMRPETQTIEQINREENQDIRSIRIERYGWVNYLMNTNSKVIDSRHNTIENTQEALMQTPDGARRLLVTCPTNRKFALGVPETVKTCEEAQLWLGNGLNPNRVIART